MQSPKPNVGTGPPEIDPSEIQLETLIGEGTYGKVYRGRCRGQTVAVKVPGRQKLTQKQLEDMRHEIEIMRQIYHPNCVLFMGACIQPGKLMLVTELMPGGDLEGVLQSNIELTSWRKLHFIKDTALALNWLHGINSIIHRDLKPANLLIDENMRVKVTDFGFSQLKPSTDGEIMKDPKGPKGSALWMAPEVMMRKPFTEKIDVYAFGLICWEIWTRQVLFAQYEDFKPFIQAITQRHERPPLPADAPASFCKLMEQCWHQNAEARPTFKEIIPMLDEVVLEAVVSREDARSFWRSQFSHTDGALKETVKWREFARSLAQVTGTPLVDVVSLSALFPCPTSSQSSSSDAEKEINIQRFADLVLWFGDFYSQQRGHDTISHVKLLMSKPWFHGDISRDQAERRLLHRHDGTFLVRLSSNKPDHPFTISVLRPVADSAGCAPQHKRIKHLHGSNEFYAPVNGRTQCFGSLFALIESPDSNLAEPCPAEEIANPYINTYLESSLDN